MGKNIALLYMSAYFAQPAPEGSTILCQKKGPHTFIVTSAAEPAAPPIRRPCQGWF